MPPVYPRARVRSCPAVSLDIALATLADLD
jgi:hypothetical protein